MLSNIFTVGLAAILLGLQGSEAAHATCYNLTIPVTISASNTNLSLPLPVNQSQVIDFATASASIANNITNYVEGNYTLDATYNISARLCLPTYAANSNSSTNRNDTVQFLIHGIGFDKSYWDLPCINGVNYSYTEAALAGGYATFGIDRLGVGLSNPSLRDDATIDPKNEIQTPAHIESVIHVGHSYGSILSNGLVAKHPNASDGLILQGYSANGSWVPQTIAGLLPTIAAQDQSFRFINASTGVALNSGYLLSNNMFPV
ncbi:hypothetical protein SAICODRAFT_10364 [Saitoella complicata NRRL Y-17804]|uniref:uncharacterized protein n=1 Tax=Saitoella complicata (strain BCRC 22490 / CBS 7301 / JCM 7358 / NBRC 10748 / NRRL Y-17804) TaxID=698492 RepID=UPI000867F0B9|nr:uncharacterized protein SAICODRAFT_10364 [Saitoella complicata NRRL Y-17804]ODQ49830.1 hypothetical protein SAICODRAFT_10364 [Saitoella complicata NRRL Y-17804]